MEPFSQRSNLFGCRFVVNWCRRFISGLMRRLGATCLPRTSSVLPASQIPPRNPYLKPICLQHPDKGWVEFISGLRRLGATCLSVRQLPRTSSVPNSPPNLCQCQCIWVRAHPPTTLKLISFLFAEEIVATKQPNLL